MLFFLLCLAALANFYLLVKIERFCCSIPWIVYGVWTAQIFLVRLILFTEHWYDWGLVFIQFSVFLFCCAYIIGQYGVRGRKINAEKTLAASYGIRTHEFIILCLAGLGIISVMVWLKEHGVTLASFMSKGLLKINSELAYQRYYEDVQSSTLSSLLGIAPSLLVLYTGAVHGIYGIKWRYTVLAFVPVMLMLLTTNTKAGLIADVIFYAASFCIGYMVRHHRDFCLRRKQFARLVLAGFGIFAILFFSMALRLGSLNKENIAVAGEKFSSYALGHIVAFDQWFAECPRIEKYTFGRYTFYSIFDQLGIAKREQGVYIDVVEHAGIHTNVYTVYRGFITDFSCAGTLMICILLGFLSGATTRRTKRHGASSLQLTFLAFVQILYCFYIVSILSYTTYLCMFLLFCCLVSCTGLPRGAPRWRGMFRYAA